MSDLRDLATDAKRLYEALAYLVEKQDEAGAGDVDFDEIWYSAKARPFAHHCTENLDADEAKSYLTILAGLIALADDTEKRTCQVRFLARILANYKKAELALQEIVNAGSFLQGNYLDDLREIRNDDVKIYLLIDLLLMTYLDGQVCEKQFDYAVGMMACIGIDRVKTAAIGNAVKGILEQNDKLMTAQARMIDITGIYCYMQDPPDSILVWDLGKAKTMKAEKIIFSDITWDTVPVVNIDEYAAEIIDFRGCTFKGLHSFTCIKKKLILDNCSFSDCEAEETVFIFGNTRILNCRFERIKATFSRTRHLFYLSGSSVIGTQFREIRIRHSNTRPCFGGVLKCADCLFRDAIFENIVTTSQCFADRRVFDIRGGSVNNCTFRNCTLAGGSYLLTISKETVANQLKVQDLKGARGELNTIFIGGEVDCSLETIFGKK